MTALALTKHGPVKAEDWRALLAAKYVETHDPIYPSERHFTANMDWRRVKSVMEKINPELCRVSDPDSREHRREVFKQLCAAAKTVVEISTQIEEDDMATKKAAKKAATPKTPKTPGPGRGRSRAYGDDAVISVKVEKNPKREGSAGHKAFALYKDGMTVKAFLAKGGRTMDLGYDVKRGYITITGA